MIPLAQTNVLVFGAGAVGRGFIPYAFRDCPDVSFSFVEEDPEIFATMTYRDSYRIAVAGEDSYEFHDVRIGEVFSPGDIIEMQKYDIVFSAVGVSNYPRIARYFKEAKVVISCENERKSAAKMRQATGNKNIFFGIPDVIASNTAPEELLKEDSLTVVTERGTLVVEKAGVRLPSEIMQISPGSIREYWMAKMFIHNAPHAMAAYLGWAKGCRYIHEAVADPAIEREVAGTMRLLGGVLVRKGLIGDGFARYYIQRELGRFKNRLLYDPIDRVARDPIRKISFGDRLVLGCRLCLSAGVEPHGLAKTIKLALRYDSPEDPEAVKLQSMRAASDDRTILEELSSVAADDPLGDFILGQSLDEYSGAILDATSSKKRAGQSIWMI